MANTNQGEITADVALLSDGLDDKAPEITSEEVEIEQDAELLGDEAELESDAEIEADLESTDEEEKAEEKPEEKVLPYERPTVKQIEKEFPEFFKKFPSMRDVYFREREFTSLFPTVDEAKAANEAAEALSDFRNDLFTGTGELFTSALKEAGELDKFSQRFLSNLQKTDKNAYWEAITPSMQQVVRAFYNDGVNRKDENARLSAENLSIYLFGTAEVAEGKKSVIKEESKPDPKVEQERQDLARERFKDFNIGVQENCYNGIKDLISFDKTGITPRAQALLLKEIINEVDNQIKADATHMSFVNSLWQKTKQAGYTSDLKSRIVSAYLERAKSLVPSIRRRLVAEVLGTSVKESQRKIEVADRAQSRKEPGSAGRQPNGSTVKVPNAKQVNWDKTTDMDFLNDNTTLKTRR